MASELDEREVGGLAIRMKNSAMMKGAYRMNGSLHTPQSAPQPAPQPHSAPSAQLVRGPVRPPPEQRHCNTVDTDRNHTPEAVVAHTQAEIVDVVLGQKAAFHVAQSIEPGNWEAPVEFGLAGHRTGLRIIWSECGRLGAQFDLWRGVVLHGRLRVDLGHGEQTPSAEVR